MDYQARRSALLHQTNRNALILVPSAKEIFRNGDCTFPFRQQSDFYYLTGFNEPDAIAVFAPGHDDGDYILFNRPRDPNKEIWYGYHIGQEGAVRDYQADKAYDINQFWEKLPDYLSQYETVIMPLGKNFLFEKKFRVLLDTLKSDKCKRLSVPSNFKDLSQYVNEMRVIKSKEEIEAIRKAVLISIDAHLMCLQHAREGMYEYELEAMLMQAFFRHGSRATAYSPIVSSGRNSCILHYTENNQCLKTGDLILIDAGCEWNCYASDITRTFPVDKSFSTEQKIIYELVLSTQLKVIEAIKPGLLWQDLQKITIKQLTSGLCDLGLLRGSVEGNISQETYKQFYMHGAGHWLGIDVHDVGDYKIDGKSRPLQAGMVFTVEPGIYIRPTENVDEKWWNIGVRIEDDILVTATGHDVLSGTLPKQLDDIEAIRRSA